MAKKVKYFVFLILFLFIAPVKVEAVFKDVYDFLPKEQRKVELAPNKTFQLEFKSPVDEFSTIWLKFYQPAGSTSDRVKFKIKRDGDKDWLYIGESPLDQQDYYLDDGFYYPFGFPPIRNAENKEFTVELTTLEKNKKQYTSIFTSVNGEPVFKLSKEANAKRIVIDDMVEKLRDDPFFFVIWGVLILITTGLLIKQ